MTTITIQEKATVNAWGYKRNINAKPVFNLTTGEIYSSVTDAANALNSHISDVSNCCNGKLKHTKGNRLCFVKDIPAHLDELSTMISECSDVIAEREVRRKEMEKRQETLAKLKEKHSRAKEKYDKMQNRANNAWREMAATESQIRQLENASLF